MSRKLLSLAAIVVACVATIANASQPVEIYGKQRDVLVLQHDFVHQKVVKFAMTDPIVKIYHDGSKVVTLENPVSIRSPAPRVATVEELRVWKQFFN